jgi:transcriptional regulator with XRE-family HTH domain
MADDLGKRIAAARAYTGWDRDTLADGVGITAAALQRIEVGDEELTEEERFALINAVAEATRIPAGYFTTHLDAMIGEDSPAARLDRLERKIDEALGRMDGVAREADRQMSRGKEQLDRFIASMQPNEELLRRIAAHLDVHQ